jgi:hypothetical protein
LYNICHLIFYSSLNAQKLKNNNNLHQRISTSEERIALKNIVDTFSTLADEKETQQ